MIYQFYSLAHGRTLPRMAGKFSDPERHLILDLEDSVGNCRDPEETARAKETARRLVPTMVPELIKFHPADRVLFRINDSLSGHLEADLAALNELAARTEMPIQIMVPKVRGAECLRLTEAGIQPRWRRRLRLVPLVETFEGVQNLPDTLSYFKNDDFLLSIGLLDLQLSIDRFPLHAPGSPELLSLLDPVKQALQRRKFRVLIGLILELSPRLIRETLGSWNAYFGFAPHPMSLSSEQTRMLAEPDAITDPEPPPFPTEATDLARSLVAAYEAHAKPGKNLVFHRASRFISPHEYKLAVAHLQRHETAPSSATT